MIKTLVESIGLSLMKEYPKSNVYVNALDQGFKRGDIFIVPINIIKKQMRTKWWLLTCMLDIRVHDIDRFTALSVSERLMDCLDVITYKADNLPLKGHDFSSSYIDNTLHVMVTYEMNVRDISRVEDMAVVHQKVVSNEKK